jgi:signal transduction histidine kinase
VFFLSISCFLVSFFSALIAGIVFFNNPQKCLNRIWALFCLSVSVWYAGYCFMFSAESYESALFWSKLHNQVAIAIPVFFIHFVYVFAEKKSIVPKIGYAMGVVLLSLSIVFHPYFIPSVSPKGPFNFYDNPGPLFICFTVFFLIIVSHGIQVLFASFRRSRGRQREQYRYIFLGMFLGFLGGTTSFFYVYDVPIYPGGVLGVLFYVVLTAIAITKQQLMDIRIVFSQGVSLFLTGVIAIASVGLFFLGLNFPFNHVFYPLVLLVLLWALLGRFIFKFILFPIQQSLITLPYTNDEFTKLITGDVLQVEDLYIALELIAASLKTQVSAVDVWALFPFSFDDQNILSYRFTKLQVAQSLTIDFDVSDSSFSIFRPLEKSQNLLDIKGVQTSFLSEFLDLNQLSWHSALMPISSSGNFYGFLVIGPKQSGSSYYKSDLDFFDTVSHYTAAIFDRIVHQEHLLFLNAKIAQLNESLENRVREELVLRQKALDAAHALSHRASLSTLTLGIAHEIRNPLTIIESAASYTLDLIQSRTKILKLIPTSKPVMSGLFSDEFVTDNITHNLETTQQLRQFLMSELILDSEGRPLENQNPIHPRFVINLPQNHEMFHMKLLAYLKQIYAETQVINFLKLASQEAKRVVTIADSMMMYGATGEGLSRSAFTEQLGSESSEVLWDELLRLGYLDSEGHITELFTPDFREEDLNLSEC